MNLKTYLSKRKRRIDKALDRVLPRAGEYPKKIHSAMRYAVFSGGKRIRPILTLASCEAAGGRAKDALSCAAAIELMHTYSLVHDDMPFCDNDSYRRGKLTVHKKYGPTIGLLCGDALLTKAFEVLAQIDNKRISARAAGVISRSGGTYGMIGGQVADLEANHKELGLALLQYIHTHKTGALIKAAVEVGALCAGASAAKSKRLIQYGEHIGLAFQIVDDILDNDGYTLNFGISGAYREATRLTTAAKRQLKGFGRKRRPLEAIADYVLKRKK